MAFLPPPKVSPLNGCVGGCTSNGCVVSYKAGACVKITTLPDIFIIE